MKKWILLVLALPAFLVAFEAFSFYDHNRTNGTLASSGRTREYLLYVPRSYDRSKPAPLVISLHGAGGWPVQQMELSGWNEVADREGFIVVYPAGIAGRGPRVWRAIDVRFISDLIDKLDRDWNIDERRIYANGLSNGAGMSFALSCALSDRIASVGMVSAAQTIPWEWCANRPPVPMITFHGTADRLTPYRGGSTWLADRAWPDIGRWTEKWSRRNGCASRYVESSPAPDVTRREYTGCANDASVVMYTMHGGGHVWPGGGPMPEWFVGPRSDGVNATREMWKFFEKHPLTR